MQIDAGNIISWIIIFVGWWVVNGQNNSRETRKEVRASLLSLYQVLDGIEDDAFAYHTGGGDPMLARKIRREIIQVPSRIVLSCRGSMTCNYGSPLARFRQAVTLENFDTAGFAPKLPTDPFFDEIVLAKAALITRLEGAYNQAYS